jgi:hypothetical protein
MNRALHIPRNLLHFGIPLLLLGTLAILMQSFQRPGLFSLAITIDLLLTVPLVYLLLIRKTTIPKTSAIPLMLAGLLLGYWLLPEGSQQYLDLFKRWVLPILEITVLSLVVVKVRKAVKQFRHLKTTQPDFYDLLTEVCQKLLPKKLVFPFATEVAMFYYAFVQWGKRTIAAHEFTYHKKSGTIALFGAFIMAILVETVALHFLLTRWSAVAAWILTSLSIYTAIQVLAFAKALGQRPLSLQHTQLLLRYSIMHQTTIPYTDIALVELSSKELEKDKLTRTLSPLGALEGHNVVLHLKRPNTLIGLYGVKRKYTRLALLVDEPQRFKEAVESACL